jgi:hypothetical protein
MKGRTTFVKEGLMAEIFVYLSAIATLAPGHTVPDGVVFRAVQVVVRSSAIEVRYQLGLSDNMIQGELRALSQPGTEIPTDAAETIARYRDIIAPLLPKRIRVTIDGDPVTMRVHRADIVRQPHRQLELVYHIPFTPGTTPAKFVLWDDNFQGVPGYHFAAMRARGDAAVLPIGNDKPLVRLPSVPEPGEAVSVPLEPMRGLAAYVCLAGVSPPPGSVPAPALAAEQDTSTGVIVHGPPATGGASRSATEAVEAPPAVQANAPVTDGTSGRVVWMVGWGVAAVLIAVAWWWTSRTTRKEPGQP